MNKLLYFIFLLLIFSSCDTTSRIVQENKTLKNKVNELEQEKEKAMTRIEVIAKDDSPEPPILIRFTVDEKYWKYLIFDAEPLTGDALIDKVTADCMKNCDVKYDVYEDRQRIDPNIEKARLDCIANCLKKQR